VFNNGKLVIKGTNIRYFQISEPMNHLYCRTGGSEVNSSAIRSPNSFY